MTEAASSEDQRAESTNGPAQAEEAAPTASIVPAWLGDAPPEGAFAGLVRIELPEDALPWRGTMNEQVLRRRAQYTAGVEFIASNFGALSPFAWDGDALLLVFGDVPAPDLPAHTFKAAKDLWNRIRAELDLHAKLAAHVGRVRPSAEPGLVTGRDVETCQTLAADAPAGTIALSEELALALPEAVHGEVTVLGNRPGSEQLVYAFPRRAAAPAVPGLVVDETSRLWGKLRRYATGPGVRLVAYVGFRLSKREPPRLDIRDVFVRSEVELRRRLDVDLRKETALEAALMSLPWSARSAGGTEDVARDFGELFARHRSLVVLGDPGSGKTTLLRWLAVTAASGSFALAARLGTAERLLPVPVSVGRLAEVRRGLGGEAVSVPAALTRYFHDRSVHEDEPRLREFLVGELERGRCLVLLDGLDEVKSDERQVIYQWLESFAAEYPQNRFIVSSRVVGYTGFQLPGDVAEAVLRPFTQAQVERYVRVFHRAYVRWETNAEPADEGQADRLLEALRASPRLQGLARNPFMLSALALIHRAEGKLPRHRVQAYEVFARALCETWAEARRLVVGQAGQPVIEYEEEALPILGELALAMHEHYPTGVAPEEFVLRKIAEALTQQKSVSGVEAKRAAREFLKRAGEDVQILLERGAGEWGFLHLTFQEFFVAAGLHAKDDFETVAFQHLFDPRWEEVIRLGVGYLALVQKRPTAAQRFVKRVLEHEEPAPRAWFTRLLKKQVPLAALLAAEAGDALPEALQQRIAAEMSAWVEVMPRNLVAPFLKELALTDFAPRVAAACKPRIGSENAGARERIAVALGALRAAGVEDALIAALSDESAPVRAAAAESLHSFLSNELLRKIEPKVSEPRPEVRAAAIEALSPLGMELPAMLVQSALQDPDEYVRAAAVGILKYRSHAEAAEAASALKQDESELVRVALSEVLIHFTDKEWLQILIGDERATLRLWTAFALLLSPKPIIDVLESSSDDRISALGRAIAPRWQSIEQRIANLRSPDLHTRKGAASSLAGVESALEALLEITDDESDVVRENVMRALGDISSERAIDACSKALLDTEARVRAAAARALAHHKRVEALGPLLDLFLQGEKKVDRFMTITALGTLGAKEALEPLMAAAQDPQEKELWRIYRAISKLASSRDADRLAAHLEGHEQPSEHSDHILNALWAIADREARRPPEPTG
ncbi:MAG TPA: HEAT repeat domain-containing protein [Polyangiaceae bacterium]|nr:HEAT repeat domain-containing protein [Polyangiaceae bacterium]